eukprot:c19187_g1_i1.p1 GENE.c19187_g1_i1~~c19187_g1_i1.p1  ORF type:complete len:1138 (+),score=193.42 c19187_g1_i1:253-3666(+)
MRNARLMGSIPTQIGHLTNLKRLHLEYNHLSGTIPCQLGEVTSLTDFTCNNNNQLFGSLPSELGRLSNLKYLELQHCYLSGSFPTQLGQLTNLLQLNLGFNQLSGSIPSHLMRLTSLVILKLLHNELSGTIPSEIGRLTALSYLLTLHNRFSGTVPSQIGQLSDMILWHFGHNPLTGTIPTQIGHLTSLLAWSGCETSMEGPFPSEVGHLRALQTLRFVSVALDGTIPTQFGKLTRLRTWHFMTTRLEGTIPTEIGEMSNLEDWNLAIARLEGVIPTQVGRLTNLRTWSLGHNGIAGEIPQQIQYLTRLINWRFSFTRVTGTIPSSIGLLTGLTRIGFSRTWLSGTIPTQLGKLTRLTYWSHSHCSLSGPIPSQIGHLTSLSYWYGAENQLDGTVPTQIGQLSALKIWSLHHNQLKGPLPSQIGNATNLRSCTLFWNRLSGSLPSQIGYLTKLTGLFLNHNQFTGAIPAPLFRIPTLRALDVANNNKITGTLPEDITDSIQSITLHSTDLKGTLPSTIALLTNLQLLDFFDTHLAGSVPKLFVPNRLLLFDTFISCSLPQNSVNQLDGTHLTAVAKGSMLNADHWDGRSRANWLSKLDANSTHLFVPYPRFWVRILLLFGLTIVFGAWPWIVSQNARIRHSPPLWRMCIYAAFGMSAVSGLYMVVLRISDRVHECADPILRVTISEIDPDQDLIGVTVLAILMTVCSVLMIIFLNKANHAHDNHARHTSKGGGHEPAGPHISVLRKLLLLLSWVTGVAALSTPVLVYLAEESFPANNSIGLRWYHFLLVRNLMPLYLVFSSDLLIPWFSGWFTKLYHPEPSDKDISNRIRAPALTDSRARLLGGDDAKTLSSTGRQRLKTYTILMLITQLLLLSASIPSQIVVHDRCMGLMRKWWEPCQGNTTWMDVYFEEFQNQTTASHLRTPVLQKADVCGHRFNSNVCVRAVIAATSSLALSKVLTQAFFVVIRAIIILIWQRKEDNRTLQLVPQGRRKGWRGWLVKKKARIIEIVIKPTKEAFTRAVMLLLMTGLMFGGMAPLIWPAVWFTLVAKQMIWRCKRVSPEVTTKSVIPRSSMSDHGDMEPAADATIPESVSAVVPENNDVHLVGVGCLWAAVGIQFCVNIWFFVTTYAVRARFETA